jgi:LysR family transcriptional regulator, hydrogen peroxide-inducible genes activator
MLSTQQIQYILSLSEQLNFSRAAESCFVTQPTLSMQIKKAEEILGFPIFDRNRNPLEVTFLGKELLHILRDIDGDLQKIKHLKQKSNGSFLEEVKIAIIPTISAYIIPLLFAQWKEKLSNVRLIIEESKSEEIIENLNHRKIDLGIMAGPYEDLLTKTISLYQEEIVAYIPSINEKSVTTDSIKKLQPWLLNKGNCLRTQMVNFCKLNENSIEDWNYEGGNIEMLMRMVRQNGGYTLLPKNYTTILTDKKDAFKKIIDDRTKLSPGRNVIGVYPQKNYKTKSIEVILNTIKEKFTNLETDNISILKWD